MPDPTLMESFDASKLALTLVDAPQVGTLSLSSSPVVEGQAFGWGGLLGGGLAYTPTDGSMPAGSVDFFVLRAAYDGSPAIADMAFAMVVANGEEELGGGLF